MYLTLHMPWIDDMEIKFLDLSPVSEDPGEVAFRSLFKDNFNRYETALFPREGGWLPSLEQVQGGEKRQGETAEEGAQVPQAARTEETAPRPSVDDQAYASSARSFKLEGSEKEPGTVTKRFSLPERVPYCVSAENFSIIEPGAGVRTERPGRVDSDREKGKDEKRQKRGERRTPDTGRGRAADRRQAERSASGVNSVRRATSKDQGGVKTLSGPPVSGTFYIYSFDGRLLSEYNLLGQLVRDYVYFGGQLVAEYRGGALYYYASDLINLTRIVTDYAGNVVYSATHEPYGGIQKTWVGTYDPELKFSGKPRDAESELDFFGPRYYDRSQFRLLSPNSVSAGSGFAPASHAWNAYSYPGNHPWAEAYVIAGWMVSATNIEAGIPYRPLKPEPEIPWWTVSYPWVSRAEDSLWVLIKSSGEKRLAEERNWRGFRENWDKGLEAAKLWIYTFDPNFFVDLITISEGLEIDMWGYISGYEYGSDPVFDAILADYGMSSDPSNPLSYWNPCYVMYHLYYDF